MSHSAFEYAQNRGLLKKVERRSLFPKVYLCCAVAGRRDALSKSFNFVGCMLIKEAYQAYRAGFKLLVNSLNPCIIVINFLDMITRPVLIIGPLSDVIIEKLILDYPHKFAKCEPESMSCNQEALEEGLLSNILIDFRRRGSKFECYTVSGIKDICDRVSFFLERERQPFRISTQAPNLSHFAESALHFEHPHGGSGAFAP